MNKYVIELRPDCKVVQQICESDGQVSIGAKSIEYFEELNSDYINEHFGELQDTAYKKGLHDGESKCRYCNEYQRGLDDAWEAARKIAQQWEEDTDAEHRVVIDDSISITLNSMTASEAIEKLKAYEEEQKADDKIDEKITGFLDCNSYTIDEVFNRLKRMKGEE